MQKRVMRFFSLTVFVLMLSLVTQASAFAATTSTDGASNAAGVNPYSPASQHSYRHGVVPTISQNNKMKAYSVVHPAATNTLAYGGGIDGIGVTSGHEKVYLVFWGTQWGSQSTDGSGNLTFSGDPDSGAPLIQKLFKGLGTGEQWSGTMTQYCDGSGVSTGATSCSGSAAHVGYPTGGAFAGAWYDNSGASPSAASGNQIANEAIKAAAHFGNTSASTNRYAQYVILSPTGANPDNYKTGGFCAWHDYNGDSSLSGGPASSPYGDIAFTNMPYVMDQGSSCGQNFVNSNGTDDGYTIVEGHEYAETVTDQNPAGGWTNTSSGQENGDECAWISSGQGASANVSMSTGTFAMQSTWSNDTNRCDISHVTVGGGGGGNDFSISANPGSLSIAQGGNGSATISTAVTSGSAATVSLTASVSPSGPTASLSPTSVTAGGSSTLTVSVGSSVAAGTYTVTVNGTEGSANHSTSVTVTVTSSGGGNNFSISASPSNLSIAQGSNGSSTISTAVTSGSAATVSLTASVSPSGPTASLSPTSVTAGGSSTLTVSVGSSVAAGTYTVTVNGTEGSANHSTSVTVTVTSSGGGGGNVITNGGFENGSSSWTESSSGGYEIVDSSNPHSGSYSAYLCGYDSCNDSIYQTVSVPSTASKITLTYWTYISTNESGSTCYDYFYARLRTTSGATISTPQKQCNANTHGWTQYSFDVTSALSAYKGKQVQVYFLGTTDSSLPTNFYVDDVALNIN
ncbi:hypothetical protein [Dictyobacter kobayashii]|uniref:MAM domain-containing protein n=1 Tax=Dictyobacter kobayashii TaxID=2014872 RepID=A0A402ANK8_9CHLR|nr:hypothetical protein [Dictyobacter kobayashii]GCE20781.1 hypothetical protein KDK_45810 [Dictyobacter kobayashii]